MNARLEFCVHSILIFYTLELIRKDCTKVICHFPPLSENLLIVNLFWIRIPFCLSEHWHLTLTSQKPTDRWNTTFTNNIRFARLRSILSHIFLHGPQDSQIRHHGWFRFHISPKLFSHARSFTVHSPCKKRGKDTLFVFCSCSLALLFVPQSTIPIFMLIVCSRKEVKKEWSVHFHVCNHNWCKGL